MPIHRVEHTINVEEENFHLAWMRQLALAARFLSGKRSADDEAVHMGRLRTIDAHGVSMRSARTPHAHSDAQISRLFGENPRAGRARQSARSPQATH
mmetsp:Transcript_21699/g.38139  ORF Transcript_21699/g.38139 Transcript_21699/m.38139 type:complete len:97 (+) Transcript_21699:632-922(+)